MRSSHGQACGLPCWFTCITVYRTRRRRRCWWYHCLDSGRVQRVVCTPPLMSVGNSAPSESDQLGAPESCAGHHQLGAPESCAGHHQPGCHQHQQLPPTVPVPDGWMHAGTRIGLAPPPGPSVIIKSRSLGIGFCVFSLAQKVFMQLLLTHLPVTAGPG